MQIDFDSSITGDFERATKLEWLEANGVGGWAGSTICGANTRRYHGLLVAATRPPGGRTVLLSKLDESLETEGKIVELGCNRYPGAVHPQGFRNLTRFTRRFFPIFEYAAGGVRLRKTIAAVHGENTTLIVYEVLAAPEPFTLRLRPFVSGRDYHGLQHANPALRRDTVFRGGNLRVRPYPSTPEIFIAVPDAKFESDPDWYYAFEYDEERRRGLDFREDLFSHGTFRALLGAGDRLGVIVSTMDPSGRDASKLLQIELARRRGLLSRLPAQDELTKVLGLASDQFVVEGGPDDPASGAPGPTILAGYHWFEDWGRDAMIALPGLTLVTGRFETARDILRHYVGALDQGMLPNRFPDSGAAPEYNTVDAALWFFVAAYRYRQYSGDGETVRRVFLPAMAEILEWYRRGTRYGIHIDADGLLAAGEPGTQLTWMDAKIGSWVVTPRTGKTVEVNALWYNALRIFAALEAEFIDPDAASRLESRADQVRSRFREVFWDDALGYLYDSVDGDSRDAAIRPNQIFALSLPFTLLEEAESRRVLAVIRDKLYTPLGLRSLAPGHPAFRAHYGGDPYCRDSAYHQGTVWSWLLGPYITALRRFGGPDWKRGAVASLQAVRRHLEDGCVGTVSEIFDATPPFTPRGAVAQAWGVGEILRAYVEDIMGRGPQNGTASGSTTTRSAATP